MPHFLSRQLLIRAPYGWMELLLRQTARCHGRLSLEVLCWFYRLVRDNINSVLTQGDPDMLVWHHARRELCSTRGARSQIESLPWSFKSFPCVQQLCVYTAQESTATIRIKEVYMASSVACFKCVCYSFLFGQIDPQRLTLGCALVAFISRCTSGEEPDSAIACGPWTLWYYFASLPFDSKIIWSMMTLNPHWTKNRRLCGRTLTWSNWKK